jgi:hypothetical protein
MMIVYVVRAENGVYRTVPLSVPLGIRYLNFAAAIGLSDLMNSRTCYERLRASNTQIRSVSRSFSCNVRGFPRVSMHFGSEMCSLCGGSL